MAAIREKRGGWQAYWREGEGSERRTVYRMLGPEVGTRKDAETALRALEEELDRERRSVALGAGLIRLGDALREWLDVKKERRERWTSITYEKHGRHILRHIPADTRLRDVTTDEIERYLGKREVDGASAATRRKELTSLSTFFSWVIRKKKYLLPPSPTEAVEPFDVTHREVAPCPRDILIDHLRQLHREALAKPHSHDKYARRLYAAVLRVLWKTGLRVGEVCRWKAEHLNFESRAIRVKAAKNKGGQRWVPMPRSLVALLRRRVAAGKEFVFVTCEGKPAYNALMKFRSGWVDVHPEHRPAHFHALRHSLATRGTEAGVDDRLLSKGLLGHATTTMTDHYSSPGLRRLHEAHEQIERVERAGRALERAATASRLPPPFAPVAPPRAPEALTGDPYMDAIRLRCANLELD